MFSIFQNIWQVQTKASNMCFRNSFVFKLEIVSCLFVFSHRSTKFFYTNKIFSMAESKPVGNNLIKFWFCALCNLEF